MPGAVLAIDQGTSGTKALVLDGADVVALAERELRPRYGEGGAVEQDPDELWLSVVDAGAQALAAAGRRPTCLGLANQGESVLAWDPATGEPLTPIVVWQDKRAGRVTERLAPHADELAAISGLPLDPYFSAPKLAWVREHLERGGVVTTTDTWLVHRLTGAFVTDASTASRSGVLDLAATAWSPRAQALYGLEAEAMPEVVDGAGAFGTTTAFGEPLPLTGLAVDQQAALLAQGCFAAGEAKCTYGTGAFVLVNAGTSAPQSTHGLAASVAWRLDGVATYCLDGQVFTAASAVRWLSELGVIEGADDLDRVGSQVDDTGGVAFVPALAGLGAPWWRDEARGALRGLGLGTTRGHLVRALLDGIAAQVVAAVRAGEADTGVPVRSLRVDGGLTRSRLLVQAQADLLQAPVLVSSSPHATALGVAALARLGAGETQDVEAAVTGVTPTGLVEFVEPRAGADEAAARLAVFAEAVAPVLGES